MGRLQNKDETFFINKKISFYGKVIDKEIINTSFKFAYEMAFGSGEHRKRRSGGSLERKPLEIFLNTFQGKIAELVLDKELTSRGIVTQGVDLEVFGEGIWDDGDLVANGKKLNVKSIAFFSNLFLLECKDWDKDGHYLHDSDTVNYDYFLCVRIKPNIKELFNSNKDYEKQDMLDILKNEHFTYDIPGVFSLETLKEIIKRDYVIRKGDKLNNTTMDADNYYIQSGDLKSIELMYNQLKGI